MVKIICSACGFLEGPGLTFHRFPEDVERCNQWAKLVDRHDLVDKERGVCNKNFGLCGAHFLREDFDGDQLKDGAVPIRRQVLSPPQIPLSTSSPPSPPSPQWSPLSVQIPSSPRSPPSPWSNSSPQSHSSPHSPPIPQIPLSSQIWSSTQRALSFSYVQWITVYQPISRTIVNVSNRQVRQLHLRSRWDPSSSMCRQSHSNYLCSDTSLSTGTLLIGYAAHQEPGTRVEHYEPVAARAASSRDHEYCLPTDTAVGGRPAAGHGEVNSEAQERGDRVDRADDPDVNTAAAAAYGLTGTAQVDAGPPKADSTESVAAVLEKRTYEHFCTTADEDEAPECKRRMVDEATAVVGGDDGDRSVAEFAAESCMAEVDEAAAGGDGGDISMAEGDEAAA